MTQSHPNQYEDKELAEDVRKILYVQAGQSQIPDEYYDEYAKSGLDAIMQLITQKQLEAELKGAETMDRIIRNSPDPKTDARKYLQELEGDEDDE